MMVKKSRRSSARNSSTNKKPSRQRGVWAWLLRGLVLVGIWGVVGVATLLAWYAYGLPDIRQVEGPQRRPSILILAADGSQIARYGDYFAGQVALHELPDHLPQAVLAVEDRRFYDHMGIDLLGLLRAAYVNFRAGRLVQGGSTITQQLAKNLFLTPERTFRRKVQEMMIAFWLEHTYSKDQILTAYLNRVYLGAGTYGVDAAAETYFGKSARAVNIYEAAMLAGLLKAPSRYAPTSNPDRARARAALVLTAMTEAGFLTDQARVQALHQAAVAAAKRAQPADARYFAALIAAQAEQMAGATARDLVVQTTLDPTLQRAAETAVDKLLDAQAGKKDVDQAAVLTLAPDGAIRAYVGGHDYRDSEYDRVTQAQRQPGSSFKPFVYLAALAAGLTPDTALVDAPLRIGAYAPANYDGKYRGTVTARDALAHSLNTATVRLAQQIGIDNVRRMAQRAGIGARLGHDLSLALGTSEVSLYELTGAYATLAAGGLAVSPYAITAIRTRDGQTLYQRAPVNLPRVLPMDAVATLTDMLTSVVAYGTGTRAALDRPVAGKTGTSQDYRDAWFIGYTADYVTGVWLGNDDNTPMKRVTGGTLPAQLWHDIMLVAEAALPPRPLPALSGGWIGATPSTADPPIESTMDSIGDFIGNLFGGP